MLKITRFFYVFLNLFLVACAAASPGVLAPTLPPDFPKDSLPETQEITPENAHEVTRLNFLGRGMIFGFAWSPDGKQIAAGTSSGIYLVDLGTLVEKHISTSKSTSVSFSRDGSLLASAEGPIVKVIDLSNKKVLYELKGHSGEINRVAFSPVEDIVASGSGDTTIKLWDATIGEELRTLVGHNHFLCNVAFSPDGKKLVSTAYDEESRLWDVASGQALQKLNDRGSFTFSPDGTRLASGTWNMSEATIKIWDAASGEELSKFEGAPNISETYDPALLSSLESGELPMDVTYSPDGTLLVSKSWYSHFILWDISGGKELRTIPTNEEYLFQPHFSPDGKQLAFASNKVIQVWDTVTEETIHTFSLPIDSQGYDLATNSLAFSPKGDILAAGGMEGTVQLYSIPAGELLGVLEPEIGEVRSIAFSPDGNMLAAGGVSYIPQEFGIELWDVQTQEPIWRNADFPEGLEGVQQVVFSPDGTELAEGYGNLWGWKPTSVKVWSLKDLLSGYDVDPLWESRVFTPVTYNQDGVLLSLRANEPKDILMDQRTALWDIKNSRELLSLDDPSGFSMAESVAMSPDGAYVLLGGSADKNTNNRAGLYMWNTITGRQVFKLEEGGNERQGEVHSVNFSPDGRMFASADYNGGVRIWAVETGELLAALDVPYASVVAFSPDGTLIATGSKEDTLRLWGIPLEREVVE